MTDRPADDAVPSARLLVAYVSEDDELDHVRDAAVALGRRDGAKVILYDRDSASAFADPMPNQWASQAEGAQFGDPLSDQELVKLGREPFARKVAAAREAGVSVASSTAASTVSPLRRSPRPGSSRSAGSRIRSAPWSRA